MVSLDEIIVDKDSLENFDINSLIEQWEDTSLYYLSVQFSKHSKTTINRIEHDICILIAAVTSFYYKPTDPKAPYGPMWTMGDRRSPIPADFSDQQLALLLELARRMNIASLRARLADTVWVEKRKSLRTQLKSAGDMALNSFLTLANEGLTAGDIHKFWDAFERATQLANQLNANVHQQLVALCSRAVPMMIKHDAPGILHPLLKIASILELISPPEIRAFAEEAAVQFENIHNWQGAVSMLELAASTHDKNEREQADILLLRTAEIFERAAEFVAGLGSNATATHFQTRTIEILRRVGGTREKREQCQRKLLNYQRDMQAEMASHTQSMNVQDLAILAQNLVSGKEFLDAILALVNFIRPEPIKLILEGEIKMSQKYPLSAMFGGSLLDHDGKTIARYSAMEGSNRGLESPGMRRRVIQHLDFRRLLCSQGLLRPAIRVISTEHLIRTESFQTLISQSPFVPEGREHVFCVAFERLFEGRIMEALHLLLPQFENSLRHILQAQGMITSKLKTDMTQDDLNLNEMMFGDVGAALKEIFGADLFFELQFLLVDRLGSNLRNIVAHGKVQVGEMYSHDAVYFCCMVLKLCCIPLLPHWVNLVHLDESGTWPMKEDNDIQDKSSIP